MKTKTNPVDWRIKLLLYMAGALIVGACLASASLGATCHWLHDPTTGQWMRVCDGQQQSQQQPQSDAQGWFQFQESGWPYASIVHLTDGGTGVIIEIDGQPLILTCAHKDSLANHFSVGDRCGLTLNTGQRFNTTVVDLMPIPADVSIMRVDEPMGNVQVCKVAAQAPQVGERVTLYGFPNGSFRRRAAVVTGYSQAGVMEIAGEGTGGESGGPLFNASGEVVGILSRKSEDERGQVVCCCCSVPIMQQICHRVRLRLDQLFPNRSGRLIARATPPVQQVATQQPIAQQSNQPPAQPSTATEPVSTPPPIASVSEPQLAPENASALETRLDAIDERLSDFATKEGTKDLVADTRTSILRRVDDLTGMLSGRLDEMSAWSMGKIVAGTLGLSTPIGLGIVLAARFGRRKVVERIHERTAANQSPSDRASGGARDESFHEQPEQPASQQRFRHQPPRYSTD
jgi:hypothetical protein